MKSNHRKEISISTTTHLCNNPRLVKELTTLSEIANYNLKVIFFQFDSRKTAYDQEIINKFPSIKFIVIKWHNKWRYERLLSTLLSKALTFLFEKTNYCVLPEQQIWSGYLKLNSILKKIKADIYHGHNPGTLAAVVKAAKSKRSACIFDAEDFHRGESKTDDINKKICIILENKYMPSLDTLICASPLITAEYNKLYLFVKTYCINNVFPADEFIPDTSANYNCTLRLVWFSQVVGTDRGLEVIFEALNEISDFNVVFDVYGKSLPATETYFRDLLKQEHNLNFKGVTSPLVLNSLLSGYDIGIASEIGNPSNRELCLTNKIFSYIQAGLCVLASDTPAQILLLNEYPAIGFVYQKNDSNAVAKILRTLHQDRKKLHVYKLNTLEAAKTLNWENEQQKFLTIINQLI